MHATITADSRRSRRVFPSLLLSAVALAALWFIAKHAMPYLGMSEAHYGPYFWPRRWGVVLHIAGGMSALLIGVVQLWLGLTNRTARLHRVLGRAYVGAIAVSSLAGFYLALTITGNPPYAAGLFFLCVAWVITTSAALIAIRRHEVQQHREWMMRSYAVTFAFVTFRFGVETLAARGVTSFSEAQQIMAWACWAIPLLLLEPFLQARRARLTPRVTSA